MVHGCHTVLNSSGNARFRKGNKIPRLYRPQRSWGKVMLLHVSVILFTEGGLSLSQGGLGLCLWGVSILGGFCPGGSLLGGFCLGVSVQGVSVWGVSVMETPRTVMSGRYASYWNAFLFDLSFPVIHTVGNNDIFVQGKLKIS